MRAHPSGWSRAVAAALLAIATPVAIIGAALVLFFNPIWIGFEQERSQVPTLTGYTGEEVRIATGAIFWDLIVGPPEFDVVIGGEPVLGPSERSHMLDVRGVLLPFAAFVILTVVVLIGVLAVNRHQAWAWRAMARSAGALTVAGVVAGVVLVLFFDAAFLAFHLVLFPQGNFSFDPQVARLTQLFPEQFWTETAIVLALVTLLASAAVALVAYRRASELDGRRPGPPRGGP